MTMNPSAMFCDALTAKGRALLIASEHDLYGRFLGAWNVAVFDVQEDGSRRVSSGEWYFAWVLEGRAMQDVLIVPVREERGDHSAAKHDRCGTNLRLFDSATAAWRIFWFSPARQEQTRMTARLAGAEIIQEVEDEAGGFIRWRFFDIAEDRFRVHVETRVVGEEQWKTIVELHCARQSETDYELAASIRPAS